jgi:hypothetical protein
VEIPWNTDGMTKDQEAEAILLIEDYLRYRKELSGTLRTPEAEIHELIREVREASEDDTVEHGRDSQRWFEAELKKAKERLGIR